MRKEAFVLVLVFAAASAFAAAPVHLPRVIESTEGGAPLWVLASEAFTADGELRADLFAPGRLRQLEENRARNAERCRSFMTAGVHGVVTNSLDERVAAASTIVAGELIAAGAGFHAGTPGTLFAMKVSARPKTFGHSAKSELLYLFVPDADIVTSRGHFCATGGPGAVVPKVGDRVIAFADIPAHDRARQLLRVNVRSGLVVERRKDAIPEGELDAMLRAIRQSPGLTERPGRSGR